MGCCPSTCRRAKRDTSTTAAGAPAIAALKERLEASASSIFHASTTDSSADLLTSNDDSTAILPSTLNASLEIELHDLEPAPVTPKEAVGLLAVVVDENAERDIRNAEPTTPEMPPEPLSSAASVVAAPATGKPLPLPSPRKAAVNYDDVPIDSMYHRIHIVQAEAQDARRQEELRAESERHEREVREFKASMLVLQPK